MTERERFIKALKREKITGRVPTFELVFYLTMEKLGKVHPEHRVFHQWGQRSVKEKELQLKDIAYCYGEIAKIYHHSAILVSPNLPGGIEDHIRFYEILNETYGREFFILMHGDPTMGIPNGDNMMEVSMLLYEEPQKIVETEYKNLAQIEKYVSQIAKRGNLVDGVAMCSDYCFNANPFCPPVLFDELIAPVLEKTVKIYHDMGFYAIKHTDGNVMPILKSIVDCKPDAIHSLDPQGGVDLKKVKKLYGDRVAFIGNVNCGLLQTGSEEEVIGDVRRALKDGMDGYGYVFSTSNCVYTGLDLSRYELINKIWYEEGIYNE
jgi:uroporphyrinogen decarboxylase